MKKKETDEIFAMKIVKKKALISIHVVEHTGASRLPRSILNSMRYPFLMNLRYAFQTDPKLYYLLEYPKGGELFFHLKKKRRFSENETKFFIAEVGMAIGHLHSLDMVHRDLKPENIFLDTDGHISLVSFGLDSNHPRTYDEIYDTPEYLG